MPSKMNEARHCGLFVLGYMAAGLLLLYVSVFVFGLVDPKFRHAPDIAFEIGAYGVLFLTVIAGAAFTAVFLGMKYIGVVRREKVRFLSLYLGALTQVAFYCLVTAHRSDLTYWGSAAVMPAVASLVDYKYGA